MEDSKKFFKLFSLLFEYFTNSFKEVNYRMEKNIKIIIKQINN